MDFFLDFQSGCTGFFEVKCPWIEMYAPALAGWYPEAGYPASKTISTETEDGSGEVEVRLLSYLIRLSARMFRGE